MLGQIFVARQRHVGDELRVDRRGFVRMQDDDGLLRVEVGHQRVQGGVAKVLSVAVGGQFDAVSSQHLQGVACLLQCVRHIGQGQRGAEHKTPRKAGLQRGALFVVFSAHRRRSLRIAEEGLRRGHRQHRSLDAGLAHEGDVLLHVPARGGEPLVHLGAVGLDVVAEVCAISIVIKLIISVFLIVNLKLQNTSHIHFRFPIIRTMLSHQRVGSSQWKNTIVEDRYPMR